jgi:diacylglycerol kinase (ATP)
MRSFHLLVNPASGGGAAPEAVVPVARLLREAGAHASVTYSPGRRACERIAADTVAAGDVVVAVGGDGMVGSLAGPVGAAGGLLGIVPAGRGNDFARQLGIGRDPAAVADTLLRAEPRAVDVIEVGGRVVVGSVYAGVDSLASELVDNAHRLPRRLQYPYAAVRAIATFPPTWFRVVVDGDEHRLRGFNVVVANSGYYGAGMHVAPDAALDDGLLDVVFIGSASRLRLLRSMPKLYDGTHTGLDGVRVLRGREVTIDADGVVAYGDGERVAAPPVTARVQPQGLRALC